MNTEETSGHHSAGNIDSSSS